MADRLDTLQLDINPLQTALSIGYKVPGLIGHLALPWYRVGGRTFRAPIYGTEAFRLADAHRALRSKPKTVEFSVSYTDVTLEEYALSCPLDYREIEALAVPGIDGRSRARATAQRNVIINREKAIADILQATANHGANSSPSTKWDNSGTPLVDIQTAVDSIRGKVGVEPNTMVLGYEAWSSLKTNSTIIAALPGGTGADRTSKLVTVDAVRDLLGLERILIGKAAYYSGSAFVDIWGDNCILMYTNQNPTEVEEPTYGFTAVRQFGEVDGLPVLGVAGEDQESRWMTTQWYVEWYKAWVANANAGYILTNVST